MTDIEEWLDLHADELAEIARDRGTGPGLVHLLAVLVLGGFEDERIVDQLRAHVHLEHQERLRDVPAVVQRIRDLLAA